MRFINNIQNKKSMNFIIFLISSAIFFMVLLYFKKFNNLKKHIYNISSLEHDSKTRYYIVYEQSHGVFIDTRFLSKIHSFFLNKRHVEILSTLYKDEQVAINSLQQFKKEINHLSIK